MKKLLLIIIYIFSFGIIYAQNATTREEMLTELNGKYNLDDEGVYYMRIIECPNVSKDELYTRSRIFFSDNYASGKSVIDMDDKNAGVIIGRGIFDVHFDTWHSLRIDIKEGKVRAILRLESYDCGPNNYLVTDMYPINPRPGRGLLKNPFLKAFYQSHYKALYTLDKLQEALYKNKKSVENDNW